MSNRIPVLLLALLAACRAAPSSTSTPSTDAHPKSWVRAAVDAMGGEAALRDLPSVRIGGVLDRPGTSWSPDRDHPRRYYEIFDELRDFRTGSDLRRSRYDAPNREGMQPTFTQTVSVDAALFDFRGQARPAPFYVDRAHEALARDPLKLLLPLLDADSLVALPDTVVDGAVYHVVRAAGDSTRVLFDAVTALPLETIARRSFPGDPEWTAWGDVTEEVRYASWSLEPNGVRYPRTWTVTRNRRRYETTSVTALGFPGVLPADSFPIPDSLRVTAGQPSPRALGTGDRAPREIADGVVFVPGGFNALLVRQDDGVVVVDAPIDADYSRLVLGEAARRFPGLPVKALVSSDFMWPHDAGVREYVARGIPIYASPLNLPMLRAMAAAPHRLDPDSLERAPRTPDLRGVEGRTVVGSGPDRAELFTGSVPGADYGPRIVVTYLPGRRVLYASELFPSDRLEPVFRPQNASELVRLVEREHLDVDTVVGTHVGPTPWADVVAVAAGGEPAGGA